MTGVLAGASFCHVNTGRELIAIVDDEESIRRALKRLMVAAGFRAQSFATGAEFLASLATTHPLCVILDLHMPVMSGFDVQQRLHDAQLSVPVIVITGHDAIESQQRALAAGAVAYLRKPVNDEALLHAIETAVSTKPTE
jgi:FixJ family two-component response regulator